jgi:hypothetical protein
MCTPDTLVLSGARHLDHGHAGPYVNQEIGINVRSGLGKLHRLGVGIAVGEHFVGNFGDEKVQAWRGEWLGASQHSIPVSRGPTDDQTFHLLLPQDVDVQRLLELIVEFVCAPSSCHDTQLIAGFAISFFVLLLELADEVDADVDPVGFEVDKVQATAIVLRVELPSKVDELRE